MVIEKILAKLGNDTPFFIFYSLLLVGVLVAGLWIAIFGRSNKLPTRNRR